MTQGQLGEKATHHLTPMGLDGIGHGNGSSDHHPWQREAGDPQGLQLRRRREAILGFLHI